MYMVDASRTTGPSRGQAETKSMPKSSGWCFCYIMNILLLSYESGKEKGCFLPIP